jgi:hypothetical protein
LSKSVWSIVLNRLTEAEKFAHFREAVEGGGAVYTAGTTDYDAGSRTWFMRDGSVCNQFVNFFLGYWFNHNAAFTRTMSIKTFYELMDEAGSSLRRYSKGHDGDDIAAALRGFSDVMTIVPAASGMIDRESNRIRYVRVDNDQWDTILGRFTNANFTGALGAFNVYSVFDGVTAGRPTVPKSAGHHGGLLLKPIIGPFTKFAADGSKKGGKYTRGLITVKEFKNPATNKNLHLRIGRLHTLRPGGFAPALPASDFPDVDHGAPAVMAVGPMPIINTVAGRCVPEAELNKKTETITPNFRHSLPRFVKIVK